MLPNPEVCDVSPIDYLKVITRHPWVMTLSLVVGAFLFFYHQSTREATYTARSVLLLKKSHTIKILRTYDNPITEKPGMVQYVQEQLKFLKSKTIAERVVKKLNLDMRPESLLGWVRLEPVVYTALIIVSVEGEDPELIADIANTWVTEFIEETSSKTESEAVEGKSRVDEQLEQTMSDLKRAQEELSKHRKSHGVILDEEKRVEHLRKQKELYEERIIEESAIYGVKHQKMIALREAMELVAAQLTNETAKLHQLQSKRSEATRLEQDVETYLKVYHELIERSKLLNAAMGLTSSDIQFVEPALPPTTPKSQPLNKLVMLLALGPGIGVFLCICLEYLDRTIRLPEELEHYAKVPFIASVPNLKGSRNVKRKKSFRICFDKPYSKCGKAFRDLRASLCHSLADGTLQTLVVTSAVDGEGKSFISSNLAIYSASEQKKVLLIDGDLHQRMLTQVFDRANKPGLSSVLTGDHALEDMKLNTDIPGLSFLPSGPTVPDTTNLLEGKPLLDFLETIRKQYDFIVVDAPPVIPDALILAGQCDGTILVIKAGKTATRKIRNAYKKIETWHGRLIGGVLNRAKLSGITYYE